MPYLSRKILVSLCPLVNLDLFKKGFYNVKCRLIDQQSETVHSVVQCTEVRDLLGPHMVEFVYPGANKGEDHFVSQTITIEYTDQSFALGESFIFTSSVPIQQDYTEVYVPSHFTLQLDLMFSGAEELPKGPSEFACVSSRSLSFTIDWRKGLHDYFPVLFDYFHLSAIGVSVYASLFEFNMGDYPYHNPPSTGGASVMRRGSRLSLSNRRASSYQLAPSSNTPGNNSACTLIYHIVHQPGLDLSNVHT